MTGLLLDTQIVLAVLEGADALDGAIAAELRHPAADASASVASLWEIAIKTRLGKLVLRPALGDLPDLLAGLKVTLLDVLARHVLAEVSPWPATRDPFDRLLLAQCAVEGLRLVTVDRALAAHPLAWRAA